MNVMDALTSRKSVRSFTGKIADEELKAVLAAAQASAVGNAAYDTVKLTVITDEALLSQIDANAATFFGDPSAPPLYGAPTLVVVSTQLAGNPMDNVAYSNAATIAENMILEAVELGVGTCHIWGATMALSGNADLVSKLGLPEGFTPICAVALGKTNERYEQREIPADRIAVNYI